MQLFISLITIVTWFVMGPCLRSHVLIILFYIFIYLRKGLLNTRLKNVLCSIIQFHTMKPSFFQINSRLRHWHFVSQNALCCTWIITKQNQYNSFGFTWHVTCEARVVFLALKINCNKMYYEELKYQKVDKNNEITNKFR